MDFSDEHAHFLHHYQQLEFNTAADGKPSEKADHIRSIISQLQIAYENDMISDSSFSLLTNEQLQRYSDIVDSLDEQTGLNNYAEGALGICSLHRNESQKWESSLSLETWRNMDCVQNVVTKNQKIWNYLLPENKQNTVLISCGETPQQKPPVDVNCNGRGLDRGLQSAAYESGICQFGRGPSKSIEVGTSLGHDQVIPTRNTQKMFSSVYKPQNSSVSNDVTRSGNVYHEVDTRRPIFAKNGHYGGGNFDATNPTTQQRRNEYQSGVKRPFRDSDSDMPDNQNEVFPTAPFRTAKEQLSIDNQKKYAKGQGQVSTSLYGNVKKSLGPSQSENSFHSSPTSLTVYNMEPDKPEGSIELAISLSVVSRRGPSSKFVPPVMNRDEDNSNVGNCVNKVTRAVLGNGGSNSNNGGSNQDEPVDERLKGIEPKMIELIMNEIMDHGPHLTWDDIAGLEFAKKTIKEIVVWPMLRPDIFTGLRGPPKGLLLFGPPGTGKTLIGKCIASQSKSTFFSISASSLTSKWVGEGEKMVRALFAVARCNQPAVVFIDEIDSLLSQRSDGEHEASRRIKTEFLVQLDGAATVSDDRILVIGATNRPQEIDEAARRRFVKRLYIPLPEGPARQQIVLNLLSQQTYQLTESDLGIIVQNTDGYSGADMSNLCREAALGPIRSMSFGDIENISADQVRPILFEDFEAAFSQVRASVSDKDLDLYIQWNSMYGSAGTGK